MLALLGKHFVDPSVIFIQNVLSVWNRFVRALEDELSPRPTRRLLLWYACQVSVLSNIRLLVSVTRLGDFLEFGQLFKALATINLPKLPTFLGNFCKGVKIFNFSSGIIFGNFYGNLAIFSGHTGWSIYTLYDNNLILSSCID